MHSAPELLINAYSAHQIDLVKASNAEAKKFEEFFAELADYLQKRLQQEGDTITTKKRLSELLKDIKEKQYQLFGDYSDLLVGDIKEMVQLELDFNETLINKFVVDYTSAVPSFDKAWQAITQNHLLIGYKGGAVDWSSLVSGWQDDSVKRVANKITTGFYTGQTVQQMAREIVGTKSAKYQNGVINLTRKDAFTVAKTAVMHMATQAKDAFYRENSDLIVGVKVVATLDSHTSDYCRGVDGKVYLYADYPDSKYPKPPYHYSCRTVLICILSDEYEWLMSDAKRPSVTTNAQGGTTAKQVDAGTTYYSWLKTQPKATIYAALGKTQGDIFMNAGLSADEFSEVARVGLNQSITIDMLKSRNTEIAKYLETYH